MVTLFNTMHDVVVVKVMNDVEGQCGRGCHCSKTPFTQYRQSLKTEQKSR